MAHMPIAFETREAQEVARALAAVAAADGAILSREEACLDGFAVAHGVGGHAWIATPLDEGALARAVTDPAKRREVVRLCLVMAFSDNDYHPVEQRMIERIAKALDVGDDELALITLATQPPPR
jgi:tellurite resistance protein